MYIYVKAMSRELPEINMIQKRDYKFWCIYQGHGYVKRASLNKYDTKKGLYFFWICQGYVMAVSRGRNPLEK